MSDLIDRQALLKQIDIDSDGEPGYYGDTWKFIDTIKSMPPATQLSTNLAEVGTDCISREQAIDAIGEKSDEIYKTKQKGATYPHDDFFQGMAYAENVVKQLPPIHPVNNSEMPNGSDVISRQAAIDALERAKQNIHHNIERAIGDAVCGILDEVENGIKQLPSAEPKRGRWISADAIFGGVPFYCSECGENTRDTVMGEPRWNFCPNCGADMRGEQNG